MVCIAAFIILSLLSIFVGFLSLFNKQLGKKYWAVFKKAWHCVFKKVRLQKCDTNFKDDVKNTLLKRIILKNPKLLKPASFLIEAVSILIVFITVWSFVIAVKSLLTLWVFGTCNVSAPSQCGLGAESCSIDQAEPTNLAGKIGRSFSEWGEIFSAIPDRLKTWQEKEYFISASIPLISLTDDTEDQSKYQAQSKQLLDFYQDQATPEALNIAIDLVDPGCVICMQSYRNQKQSGFFDRYFTVANLYAIPTPEGGYKFANSKLISDYIDSLVQVIKKQLQENHQGINLDEFLRVPSKILDRLYSESKDNRNYIDFFNYSYDQDAALSELDSWSKEFGLSKTHRKKILDQVKQQLSKREEKTVYDQEIKILVEEKIKAKGIPVEIYDGKKHNGLYKASS